jgi:hypothetical protein
MGHTSLRQNVDRVFPLSCVLDFLSWSLLRGLFISISTSYSCLSARGRTFYDARGSPSPVLGIRE